MVGEFVWGDRVDVVLDRLGVVMFDGGFDAVRCVGGGVWLVEKVGRVLEDGSFLVSGWCGDAGNITTPKRSKATSTLSPQTNSPTNHTLIHTPRRPPYPETDDASSVNSERTNPPSSLRTNTNNTPIKFPHLSVHSANYPHTTPPTSLTVHPFPPP